MFMRNTHKMLRPSLYCRLQCRQTYLGNRGHWKHPAAPVLLSLSQKFCGPQNSFQRLIANQKLANYTSFVVGCFFAKTLNYSIYLFLYCFQWDYISLKIIDTVGTKSAPASKDRKKKKSQHSLLWSLITLLSELLQIISLKQECTLKIIPEFLKILLYYWLCATNVIPIKILILPTSLLMAN